MTTPATAEQTNSHHAHSLFQSLQNAGKRDWTRQARSVAYQMYADEQTIRHAIKLLTDLGATTEQLKPFVARVGEPK